MSQRNFRLNALLATVAAAALLSGCSSPGTRVVLLPQDGQAASAVLVTPRPADGQEATTAATLDKPYASVKVDAKARISTEQVDPGELLKQHRQLFAAQPPAAKRYTLYFQAGKSSLTPESLADLGSILTHATERAGSDIVVTGHTDSVGNLEANDQLSLQRALAVREMILQRGFDGNRVEAVGRGEREPLIPTADEVQEPRNRRAEISVR